MVIPGFVNSLRNIYSICLFKNQHRNLKVLKTLKFKIQYLKEMFYKII